MKFQYIRVARRALTSADSSLSAGVQEKAGFLAYHAFESSGSALGTHFGLDMGKRVGHTTKIKRFQHTAKKVGLGRKVAMMAVRIASMRNLFLYPEALPGGSVILPEKQITPAKAKQLVKDVRHLVDKVEKNL